MSLASSGSGVWLIRQGAIALSKSRQSLNWPHVEGEVTSIDISTTRTSNGTSYFPEVHYVYAVEGEVYRGSTIAFGNSGSGRRGDAQRTIANYFEGKVVEVFYQEDAPQVSRLRPGWVHPSTYGFFICGGFFVLAAVVLPLCAHMANR